MRSCGTAIVRAAGPSPVCCSGNWATRPRWAWLTASSVMGSAPSRCSASSTPQPSSSRSVGGCRRSPRVLCTSRVTFSISRTRTPARPNAFATAPPATAPPTTITSASTDATLMGRLPRYPVLCALSQATSLWLGEQPIGLPAQHVCSIFGRHLVEPHGLFPRQVVDVVARHADRALGVWTSDDADWVFALLHALHILAPHLAVEHEPAIARREPPLLPVWEIMPLNRTLRLLGDFV